MLTKNLNVFDQRQVKKYKGNLNSDLEKLTMSPTFI